MQNLFLFLPIILISQIAYCQSDNRQEPDLALDPIALFQKAPQDIIARLQFRGVDSIGKFSLSELEMTFSEVTVLITSSNAISPLLRTDGRTDSDFRTISIQKSLIYQFTNRPEHQAFALHEHLGAAGFDDTHYQISTLMTWMSITEPKHLKRFLQSYPLKQMIISKGGGSTVFDGGGDLDEIQVQLRRLKDSLERSLALPSELIPPYEIPTRNP